MVGSWWMVAPGPVIDWLLVMSADLLPEMLHFCHCMLPCLACHGISTNYPYWMLILLDFSCQLSVKVFKDNSLCQNSYHQRQYKSLNDLIKRKEVNLSEVEIAVLDEADEMLNMGFKDELDSIFAL